MPALDLVDDTYLDVPPAVLAALVRDPARWVTWWPDLDLEVTRDRGDKGVQWAVVPARAARTGVPTVLWTTARWTTVRRTTVRWTTVRWTGTAEVWLEPWRERGTVLHHYQRLDPLTPPRLTPAQVDRLRAGRATAWKHHVHRLKDEVEGVPPAPGHRAAGQDGDPARRSQGR